MGAPRRRPIHSTPPRTHVRTQKNACVGRGLGGGSGARDPLVVEMFAAVGARDNERFLEMDAGDPFVVARTLILKDVSEEPRARKPFIARAVEMKYDAKYTRRAGDMVPLYNAPADDPYPRFSEGDKSKLVKLSASDVKAMVKAKRERAVARLWWMRAHASPELQAAKTVCFDDITACHASRDAVARPAEFDVCPRTLESGDRYGAERALFYNTVAAATRAREQQSLAAAKRARTQTVAEEAARKVEELQRQIAAVQREAEEARVKLEAEAAQHDARAQKSLRTREAGVAQLDAALQRAEAELQTALALV